METPNDQKNTAQPTPLSRRSGGFVNTPFRTPFAATRTPCPENARPHSEFDGGPVVEKQSFRPAGLRSPAAVTPATPTSTSRNSGECIELRELRNRLRELSLRLTGLKETNRKARLLLVYRQKDELEKVEQLRTKWQHNANVCSGALLEWLQKDDGAMVRLREDYAQARSTVDPSYDPTSIVDLEDYQIVAKLFGIPEDFFLEA